MRLARETVGPGSNNSSTITDTDLDSELILRRNNDNRRNSDNSLLTTTSLESRERESEKGQQNNLPQSRSGTISPISDSFLEDTDAFNYNGLGGQPTHQSQYPTGSGIASRRSPASGPSGNANSNNQSQPRPDNFHQSLRGPSPNQSQSSSQSMHAQATAQMAMLIDYQRREGRDGRDGSKHPDDDQEVSNSSSLGVNIEQVTAMARLRMEQRVILQNQAQNQARQNQEQEFQKSLQSMQSTRQQQPLGERRRVTQNSSPNGQGFDDFRSNGHNQYDRNDRENDNSSSHSLGPRDREYDSDRFRGSNGSIGPPSLGNSNPHTIGPTMGNPSPNMGSSSDLNDFRFGDREYAPPPVMEMMRKQQVILFLVLYFS
jgi:hypothetical protein